MRLEELQLHTSPFLEGYSNGDKDVVRFFDYKSPYDKHEWAKRQQELKRYSFPRKGLTDYLTSYNQKIGSSAKTIKNIDQTPIQELITKYKIGGVLFLGKTTNPQTQKNLTTNLQRLSSLPLFVAQDLEWGLSMRLYDTIQFPHNMTLGALQDNNLIYQLANEIARQCKLIGVNINLAPVVDINTNPDNPIIGTRSFGQDKNKYKG